MGLGWCADLAARNWTQHHDRSVESFCRRWFPQERFDLIHSHCIQVLGVGPLQVARELGIPYAITCTMAGGCRHGCSC